MDKTRRNVPLKPEYHAILQRLAEANKRSMTRQLEILIDIAAPLAIDGKESAPKNGKTLKATAK